MELSTALHPAALSLDGVVFKPTIGPECHVLPIGASALAEYLSTMAIFNGFAVTMCDPHSEYRGT